MAATLAALAAACAPERADVKLPPAPQTLQERHGEDPDRDLFLQAQGAIAESAVAWSATGY
jgi:hypothetical protein